MAEDEVSDAMYEELGDAFGGLSLVNLYRLPAEGDGFT